MKLQILVSPEVLIELSDAANWYELKQKGLGVELIESFWQELKYVQKYPKAFPVFNKRET